MSHRCTFCGKPVSDQDYDYISGARVWICGSTACDKEARDADRAAHEQAVLDAIDDNYGRYM